MYAEAGNVWYFKYCMFTVIVVGILKAFSHTSLCTFRKYSFKAALHFGSFNRRTKCARFGSRTFSAVRATTSFSDQRITSLIALFDNQSDHKWKAAEIRSLCFISYVVISFVCLLSNVSVIIQMIISTLFKIYMRSKTYIFTVESCFPIVAMGSKKIMQLEVSHNKIHRWRVYK